MSLFNFLGTTDGAKKRHSQGKLRGGRGQKGIPIDRTCAIGENAAQRYTAQPRVKGTTTLQSVHFCSSKDGGESVNTGVIRLKTGRR